MSDKTYEPNKQPLVVAYGGGVNSTAMLVEMHRRGIRPDLILFADTGGERPETYAAVEAVSAWCVARGMPAIGATSRSLRTRKGTGRKCGATRWR